MGFPGIQKVLDEEGNEDETRGDQPMEAQERAKDTEISLKTSSNYITREQIQVQQSHVG